MNECLTPKPMFSPVPPANTVVLHPVPSMVPSPGAGSVNPEQSWAQQLFLLLLPEEPHSIPANPLHPPPSFHLANPVWQTCGLGSLALSWERLGLICCYALDTLWIIPQDKQLSWLSGPEQCYRGSRRKFWYILNILGGCNVLNSRRFRCIYGKA